MKVYNKTGSFFETPGLITKLLLAANFAGFMLCYYRGSQFQIPGGILFSYGALYRNAISDGQYWRLLAAGFLHANPIHLVLNMICLVSWGGLLEKRVGPFYFIILYLFALLAGSAASIYGHSMNYIGVGASGALSGVVGALFCLFVLDKIRLSGQFFVGAIGLNAILMVSVPRVDWWSHLGGFTAGLICCAVIDLVAKLNKVWLRCKFPEFIKLNVAISVALVAMLGTDLQAAGFYPDKVTLMIGVAVFTLVLIKLIDLLLATTRGIAFAVLGFAAFYVAVPLIMRQSIVSATTDLCQSMSPNPTITDLQFLRDILPAGICPWLTYAPYMLSALLAAVTIIIHRAELARGLKDVGFVAATLRADRNRCQGI